MRQGTEGQIRLLSEGLGTLIVSVTCGKRAQQMRPTSWEGWRGQSQAGVGGVWAAERARIGVGGLRGWVPSVVGTMRARFGEMRSEQDKATKWSTEDSEGHHWLSTHDLPVIHTCTCGCHTPTAIPYGTPHYVWAVPDASHALSAPRALDSSCKVAAVTRAEML